MFRRIIIIDEEKCNGCGACVDACHEGAIGLENGKAILLRDDYCDGLGDCLPACPTDAISFEERDTLPYDEAAVMAAMAAKKGQSSSSQCAGIQVQTLMPIQSRQPGSEMPKMAPLPGTFGVLEKQNNETDSCLHQWPIQIKLVPVNAPYFSKAHLLIAADCTAFAHGNFHDAFMRGKVTLIGCPKLDSGDYADKLAEIFGSNSIESITVARMSVPCCGGIERAVQDAMMQSQKKIPLDIVTIDPNGVIQNN